MGTGIFRRNRRRPLRTRAENYPEASPVIEFGAKEMKGLNEDMQHKILLRAQQSLSPKTGKLILKEALDNILNQVKLAVAECDSKSIDAPQTNAATPKKRKNGRKRYILAANFGLQGSTFINTAKVLETVNSKANAEKQKAMQDKGKQRAKAPPMKTARDVINRLKWDDQLKDEVFMVGYKDRFCGIIEVPVFELNWLDDIASTGPTDQLAIPEHRVQYFKWNSRVVWEKESRKDLVFGSTGSKIEILEYIRRHKEANAAKIGENSEVSSEISKEAQIELENPQESESVKTDLIQKLDRLEISAKQDFEVEGLKKATGDCPPEESNTMNSVMTKEETTPGAEDGDSIPTEFHGLFSVLGSDAENEALASSSIQHSAREVAGGSGHHSSNTSHHSGKRGESGFKNGRTRSRESRSTDRKGNRREDRNGRDGSHNRQRPDGPSSPTHPPNYCVAVDLADHDWENVEILRSKLLDQHHRNNLQYEEYLYINVGTLRLETPLDAERVNKALGSLCSKSPPIKASAKHLSFSDKAVILHVENTDLENLFKNLQPNLEPKVCFSYCPHIKLASARNCGVNFQESVKPIFFNIRAMYLWPNTGIDFSNCYARSYYHKLQGRKRHHMQDPSLGSSSYKQTRHDEPEKDMQWETFVSKRLAAVLRHNAMGLEVDEEGCIEVHTLLKHNFFLNNWVNEDDIVRIVRNNNKKRFALEGVPGNFKIRANQGHTVQVENLHLQEIKDPEMFPNVIHGTSLNYWDSISKIGLNRMNRNHIHMTTAEPHSSREVISGMRSSSNCFIYVNMKRAIADGIKFFLSDNGVILSEGKDGVLDPKYFRCVYGIKDRQRVVLWSEETAVPPETETVTEAVAQEKSGKHGADGHQKRKKNKKRKKKHQ